MSDQHKISQDELKREFSKEDIYFRKLDEERLAATQRRVQVRKMICRREGRPEGGCELEIVDIDGVQVDRCAVCDGVWLDAHELEDLRRRNAKKEHHGLVHKFLNILVPGHDAG